MTFRAELDAVQLVRPSLGFLTSAYEPRDLVAEATIVHTTGAGPVTRVTSPASKWVRWRAKHGITDPFFAALWIYEHAMKAGPHFVVGQKRHQIAQVCPLDLCAWHVGGKHGTAYASPRWLRRPGLEWWPIRWKGLESPRELGGGNIWTPYRRRTSVRVALASLGGSVNANTWGIEVVPPIGDTSGPWSDDAWANLAEVVDELHRVNGCPRHRDRVVTHSDANPIARSARGAPWDTSPQQFSWERMALELGVAA